MSLKPRLMVDPVASEHAPKWVLPGIKDGQVALSLGGSSWRLIVIFDLYYLKYRRMKADLIETNVILNDLRG